MEKIKGKGISIAVIIGISLFSLLFQVSSARAEEYNRSKLLETFNSEALLQEELPSAENIQENVAFNYQQYQQRQQQQQQQGYQQRTYDFWRRRMPQWMPEPVQETVARIIYICDQSANTVLEVVALAGQALVKSPILLGGDEFVDMVIHFVNSLTFTDEAEVKIMETIPNTISDAFIAELEKETGVETVREEPIDKYVYNYCLETDNYPEVVVVADQEGFMPYASLYASRKDGVFVNTIAEAEKIVENDDDVKTIVYFGSNSGTAGELKDIAPEQEASPYASFWQRFRRGSSQETFSQISTIDEAEQSLTPVKMKTAFNPSKPTAVTVISAENSKYWWIAPIYAYLRDTMLISAEGNTVEEVDASITEKLEKNIIPNNFRRKPEYLIISEPWDVIPYRYFKEDYMSGRYIAADTIYADTDGDFVQDMSVGRFTAYDTPGAVALMNRGYFFDKGEMEQADKALILQPWEKNFVIWIGDEYFEPNLFPRLGLQPVQNDLIDMYGPGNVYGSIGYQPTDEYTEPDESWPSLGGAIGALRESEMNVVSGHANPYDIEATDPYFHGAVIRDYGPYPPSLWYLFGCSTGVYHPDFIAEHPEAQSIVRDSDTLIHGAITGGAVNIVATADSVPYGNYTDWPEWVTDNLVQGETIGNSIEMGQNQAAKNVNKVGVYKYLNEQGMNPVCKQSYLIGDPMVDYNGSKQKGMVESELAGAEPVSASPDVSVNAGAKAEINPAVIKEEAKKTFVRTFGAKVSANNYTSTPSSPHPVEFNKVPRVTKVSRKPKMTLPLNKQANPQRFNQRITSLPAATVKTRTNQLLQTNKKQPGLFQQSFNSSLLKNFSR